MKASSSVVAPRDATRPAGRAGRQHAAGIHQRNAVAARGLVHEMGRDEDRHALVARQVDQQLPEPVARHRIDAGGGLVEDQDFRRVHDGDSQRQALADAERQIQRALVEISAQSEAADQIGDARLRRAGRQMEQMRVQIEVLSHRQLGVERERLRHVADARPRLHVAGIDRLAEQQRLAVGGGQQAGQHFHGRRLAAAVGAEEAEDLAALDGEADAVDGGEVAEADSQVVGDDHWSGAGCHRRGNDERNVAVAQRLRHDSDEGLFDRVGVRRSLQVGRRSAREHAAGVHRDQPIEPLGLLHIGGGDNDTHARTARAHPVDQRPELAARQRIDAGGRFVQDQQVGVMDQRAAQPELLPHAARQFLRRPVGERGQAGGIEQLGDAPVAFRPGLAEQAAEERDILAHAEIGVEVAAQTLRHVGDARAEPRAVSGTCHVAAEHLELTRSGCAWRRQSGSARRICRRRRAQSARPCRRPVSPV